jgi:GGDEF domain-containing protein
MVRSYALAATQLLFAAVVIGAAAAGLEPVPVAVISFLGTSGILVAALVLGKGGRPQAGVGRLSLISRVKGDDPEKIRRTALFDAELGVYQSWYFELRLGEEIDRCRRYGDPLTVLVLKILPEEVGEENVAGWRASAAQAAHMTAQTVRTVDLTASLGPMEFGICLIHCDEDGAAAARKRLATALSHFRCSIGYAVALRDADEPRALISFARSRALGDLGRDRSAA